MNEKRHALVGWFVTQLGIWMARRAIAHRKKQLAENKAKIGAAGAVAAVLIGGIVAAKLSGDGDD
jgi:hypothetical protein